MTWWVLDVRTVFCRSDSDLGVVLEVWTVFCRSDSDVVWVWMSGPCFVGLTMTWVWL